jgi:hypothetical protein
MDRRDAEPWDNSTDAGSPNPDVLGDASPPAQTDGPMQPLFDGPQESAVQDLPASREDVSSKDTRAADAPTADTLPSDTPLAEVLSADALLPDTAPFSCASLKALVAKGALSPLHAKQVLFAPDGKSILLLVGSSSGGSDYDALLVSLPGGELRTLATQVSSAVWLGKSAVLFKVKADASLLATSLDGRTLQSIRAKTCSHAASPDGTRIYYTQDCGASYGTGSVIDVATGATKQLSPRMATSDLAVSPGSRWATYVEYPPPSDASTPLGTVHIVDQKGETYALSASESLRNPIFVSDDLLMLQSSGTDFLVSKIWRHTLGTSEVKLLAEGDVGYDDYAWNADRSGFLLAKFPAPSSLIGELYLASLADGSLVQLGSDLMDYRMFEMRINAFAMVSSSQRAIYIADTRADANRTYAIATIALNGDDRLQLGPKTGQGLVSPYGDRVALVADKTSGSPGKVVVLSASTGAQQFVVEGNDSLVPVGFIPGDRGLVLVNYQTAEKKRQLRHLVFATGAVSTLAEWSSSNGLLTYSDPNGFSKQAYPIDPNGCFVPVDSDLDPQGTRLALLAE